MEGHAASCAGGGVPPPPFQFNMRNGASAHTSLGAELRSVAEQQRASERSRLRARQTALARDWAAQAAAARHQSRWVLGLHRKRDCARCALTTAPRLFHTVRCAPRCGGV
jgi:hypothetical protein